MACKWTPEQLDAINERNRNLLVAAAAGAGKTAVLVERIIKKITDGENPVDIDKLLVVTFTNAAATEMRERIANALSETLEAEPSNVNLQKQMALLDRASIMTLHSFCLEVVRKHFQILDIDPDFRIADETECALMKLDVLEELFEEKYDNEEPDSPFFKLVESYGGIRDDISLRDMILELHDFMRSNPWPEQWLATQAEAYNIGASACLSSTPWASVLLKSAAAELQGLKALLEKASALASRAQGLEPYCGVIEEDIMQINELAEVCEAACCAAPDTTSAGSSNADCTTSDAAPDTTSAGSSNADCATSGTALPGNATSGFIAAPTDSTTPWGKIQATFSSYNASRLPRCAKNADKAIQQQVKDVRSLVKEKLKKLCESGFNATAPEIIEDLRRLYPLLKYLSEMVCEFDRRYSAKKNEKGLLDFNDLEHYCLKVLFDKGISASEDIEPVMESFCDGMKLVTQSSCDDMEPMAQSSGEDMEPMAQSSREDMGSLAQSTSDDINPKTQSSSDIASAAALELRERYEEILVDEYQDSNLIQELILSTVSGIHDNRYNMFMVGDVKQSIYRFRQARPEMFMSKYTSYPTESGHNSRLIKLYRNFRSRPEIINGVNYIFGQIMSMLVGELDYTGDEALNAGAVYEEPGEGCVTGGPVELHIIDVASTCAEINPNNAQNNAEENKIGKDNGDSSAPSPDEEEEPLDNIQTEARIVGKRIKSLISRKEEPFNVYDKKIGKYRPVEYMDIVILMRATRNWADVFSDELSAMGIPVYADTGNGYFKTVEVETMLSLLKIIDNPLQDIPLIAVLRSPIGGFSEDELADIRLADRSAPFFEALKLYSKYNTNLNTEGLITNESNTINLNSEGLNLDDSNTIIRNTEALSSNDVIINYSNINNLNGVDSSMDGINTDDSSSTKLKTEYSHYTDSRNADSCNTESQKKACRFMQKLQRWRDDAQFMPTDELVWKLLDDTGYYSYAGILPGGPERQANLRMLFERARQYEETIYKGLFNFINFVDKLRVGGGDMGSAKILGENDNVVRIMSIHKSKGLEFPVVILAGCGKKINMRDLNAGILLHQELGFGPDLVDLDKRTVTSTMPKFAIRQKLKLETLSEEMRILYVAFTRAKEKLIITGCIRNAARVCSGWCSIADVDSAKLPSYAMLQALNYLDWIGPAVARHKTADAIRQIAAGCSDITVMQNDASSWDIKMWGKDSAAIVTEAADFEGNIKKWLDAGDTATHSADLAAHSGDMTTHTGVLAEHASDMAVHASDMAVHASDMAEHASDMAAHTPDTAAAKKAETEYIYAHLINMLEWQYPFKALSSIPAKLSVTELKRRFMTDSALDANGMQTDSAFPFIQPMTEKPLFMEPEKGMSASRRGTIMHFVMQHIDLKRLRALAVQNADSIVSIEEATISNAGNRATVEQASAPSSGVIAENQLPNITINRSALIKEISEQLNSMVENEQLTEAEAKAVKPDAIGDFFLSPIAKRILNADRIKRETAFTIEIPCTEIYNDLSEEQYSSEKLLVQGVIDCWFESEDGLVLLDYKTDYVPSGGADIVKERYKVQIDYYTKALEKLTGKKVAERYLYLFHSGELLSC